MFIKGATGTMAYSWVSTNPMLDINSTTSQTAELAGGRLNKKDGLTRYGDSHVKDKTS